MALLIHAVVRRRMSQTSGFTPSEGGAALPVELALTPDESVIGWYRNPAPWEGSILAFTSSAIWTVEKGTSERIALNDLVDYESDRPGKDGVTGLRVRTRDGFRFLRVAGTTGPDGKHKDFLMLMTVLRAVLLSRRRGA